jgi:hypothetical protein
MSDTQGEMRRELEDALGEKVDQATADRALAGPPRSSFAAFIADNQLLIGITLATAVVFGVVLSVFLNSWVFLIVAVLVHGIGTLAVTALAVWLATSGERPDPRTVARMEAEGVADPEQKLNDAVHNMRSGDSATGRLSDSVKKP